MLSCTACRQKKVKCDRQSPCGHCTKAGIPCVVPIRAKTTRRHNKKTDESVLARLRQLESIVSKLEDGKGKEDLPARLVGEGQSTPSTPKDGTLAGRLDNSEPPNTARDVGRLVNAGGKTIYRPSGFWMTLTSQIALQISEVLDEIDGEESDSMDESSPHDHTQSDDEPKDPDTSYIIGFTTDAMTLKLLHPPAEQIKQIWRFFMENCKPVITTVYIATGSEMVRKARADLSSLSQIQEAWMFCMYYMVAISLQPAECLRCFGHDRATALERLRWASEQALARAGFLLSQDLLLLEAFHFYCITLSRHIDNFTVRAMTSLLVNVAHSMGLHIDGEQFNLPPFEVEWRRRLWWGVRTIDLRSSMDYDAQSLLIGRWSNCQLPTNLRDEDLWPGMLEKPKARTEPTELSFTLLRWELAGAMLDIAQMGQLPPEQRPSVMDSMNVKLENLKVTIYEKYLKGMNTEDLEKHSVEWTSLRVYKMLMARLWLIINQPLVNQAFRGGNDTLRQQAYEQACLALKMSDAVEQAVRTAKWGWLFKRLIDWQSVCIVLLGLCHQPDNAEEVWPLIDRMFARWSGVGCDTSASLEKPLRRLYRKAHAVRVQHAKSVRGESTVPNDVDVLLPGSFAEDWTPSDATVEPGVLPGTTNSLSQRQTTLDFDDFTFEDVPPLDQFDPFETVIADYRLPADWIDWTDPGI